MPSEVEKADVFVARAAFQLKTFSFMHGIGIMAILLLPIFVSCLQSFPSPDADSLSYLSYARSLSLAGTYASTEAGPRADATPGREPLYSTMLAYPLDTHTHYNQTSAACRVIGARPLKFT